MATQVSSRTATIPFSKYHGCGNDFIMIWDPKEEYKTFLSNPDFAKKMCDRFTGIGADVILHLTKAKGYDFAIEDYTRQTGKPSRLCGNGARCGAKFAVDVAAVTQSSGTFLACDGPHDFIVSEDNVSVKFADVLKANIVKYSDSDYFVDVGSPHHTKFVDNVTNVDVMKEGRTLCYSGRYSTPDETGNAGANINFVQRISDGEYRIRTYERMNDEEECPSCGTGSVAVAIAATERSCYATVVADGKTEHKMTMINNAGNITVTFTVDDEKFSNIILSGPAVRAFTGIYYPS